MGIGPSTKETTLHHFRDPLLEVLSEDEDFSRAVLELLDARLQKEEEH